MLEPLYFNNNTKRSIDSRKCGKEFAKLYSIGNILTITCLTDPINKDLNKQFVNYDDNNHTINGMFIKLQNITNFESSSLPNVYEILLVPNKTNITISKKYI